MCEIDYEVTAYEDAKRYEMIVRNITRAGDGDVFGDGFYLNGYIEGVLHSLTAYVATGGNMGQFDGYHIDCQRGLRYFRVVCAGNQTEIDAAFESAYLGLASLQQRYPDFVSVLRRECEEDEDNER